jgi:hypothetical protein
MRCPGLFAWGRDNPAGADTVLLPRGFAGDDRKQDAGTLAPLPTILVIAMEVGRYTGGGAYD